MDRYAYYRDANLCPLWRVAGNGASLCGGPPYIVGFRVILCDADGNPPGAVGDLHGALQGGWDGLREGLAERVMKVERFGPNYPPNYPL